MTVLHFIDYKYLPWVRDKKKPSTVKGYVDIFENHIRSRVNGIRLRDFRSKLFETHSGDQAPIRSTHGCNRG